MRRKRPLHGRECGPGDSGGYDVGLLTVHAERALRTVRGRTQAGIRVLGREAREKLPKLVRELTREQLDGGSFLRHMSQPRSPQHPRQSSPMRPRRSLRHQRSPPGTFRPQKPGREEPTAREVCLDCWSWDFQHLRGAIGYRVGTVWFAHVYDARLVPDGRPGAVLRTRGRTYDRRSYPVFGIGGFPWQYLLIAPHRPPGLVGFFLPGEVADV